MRWDAAKSAFAKQPNHGVIGQIQLANVSRTIEGFSGMERIDLHLLIALSIPICRLAHFWTGSRAVAPMFKEDENVWRSSWG
ncbi:hypothetical protein CGZ80_10445 [Rhodopirellula sp. MGV]|nr:hypothetical protein CGZ80_10445 [Rhodopirellula sp. MGV]